jgi:hypothetical protein
MESLTLLPLSQLGSNRFDPLANCRIGAISEMERPAPFAGLANIKHHTEDEESWCESLLLYSVLDMLGFFFLRTGSTC